MGTEQILLVVVDEDLGSMVIHTQRKSHESTWTRFVNDTIRFREEIERKRVNLLTVSFILLVGRP